MTDVKCNKCKKWTEIDDTDIWSAFIDDFSNDNITFRFTGYCENEIEDGDDWDTCGHEIEVLRYALLDGRDIEQEDCE